LRSAQVRIPGAATSSFAFFSLGAVIPVLPFLLGVEGSTAVLVAATLTGMALMLTGRTVAVLSGGPPLRRALRQFAIGTGAAMATYLLGRRSTRPSADPAVQARLPR
jgi:VIT1/CCC1 family predicted Fe2+/Mn2+ transporter